MQRRNYAALFAALVIGFGAIDADAQTSVRSVTITAPDSGATLGIGGAFTVTATVRDFTPYPQDGVIIALIYGDSVLADLSTGGGKERDPVVTQDVAPEPDVGGLNTGLPGTDLTRGTRGAGSAATDIVAVRIVKANANTDSSNHWRGDATSVSVDDNQTEVTYVWNGKIDVSSGTVPGISAVAVAVDQTTSDGAATVVEGTGARSPTSPGNVLFAVDADRPNAPLQLLRGFRGSPTTGVTGDLVTALLNRGDDEAGNNTQIEVAGIGNVLTFDVKIGPDNMGLILDENHTVEIEIIGLKENPDVANTVIDDAGDGKKQSWSVPLEITRIDTLSFSQALAEGDFGDLVGQTTITYTEGSAFPSRTRATAYIVDQHGNRSGAPDGAAAGAVAQLPFLIDTKKPVIDGVSGQGRHRHP